MKKYPVLAFLIFVEVISAYSSPIVPKNEPSTIATWISLLPAVLFSIIFLITIFWLKRSNVKLSEMLAEKETGSNAEKDKPATSVSRFIVFLTGLTTLILGVCLTCFYMYQYFINPEKPVDLSNLSTVIWGLGIGILPYGFNKASSSLKN